MDKIDKFYEEYGKEVMLSTGEVIAVDKFVDSELVSYFDLQSFELICEKFNLRRKDESIRT